MTPERINQAIAEWCGWKWYRRPASGPWAKKPMRCLYHPELMKPLELDLADMTERECNWAFIEREGMIPNYYGDLNAIHEAEIRIQQFENMMLYRDCLFRVVGLNPYVWAHSCPAPEFLRVATATAPQRCEALLRTIGRWEFDKESETEIERTK